ncbi:MAG: thiamine diphosphokinase [Prevotella sp.]|jgi:thiamine pyrophosphokinase|nr:thiamine diphosphokinase [Prevotella sp.]
MNNEMFDAVIVANGQFPTHAIPLAILHDAKHIVACDGAIHHIPQAEAVIGDGDSVPEAFRSKLIRIEEQDDNDLTKATRYCVENGWKRIAYLGCTGKREDHTLGNISLLMRYYRDMGVDGTMFTDYGFFTPAHGNRTFPSMKGQQISLWNFGSHQLASTGLHWDAYNFQEWWQGTLNEALGEEFAITADGYYMVYQTYDVKA